MAVSKPTKSDAVKEIKDLFSKNKGQKSNIAGQSGVGDVAGKATSLNSGKSSVGSVAGAVGATAVGAGASAAASAATPAGALSTGSGQAASSAASGLSGAAQGAVSGVTGGSATSTTSTGSGQAGSGQTTSTSTGQASSATGSAAASGGASTSNSGATGNTNSAPKTSGSTGNASASNTPSGGTSTSGNTGGGSASSTSGSSTTNSGATGNTPGGSASGGATSGNSTATSGGTSGAAGSATGAAPSGSASSAGSASAAGGTSGGGSGFASAAKNSTGSAASNVASSAASGNVPSASGVASAAGAGNIPTSTSGLASAAQSNIPGASNIPTSASGAMGAVQSKVPGASNIPTSASGALGAAQGKIPGGVSDFSKAANVMGEVGLVAGGLAGVAALGVTGVLAYDAYKFVQGGGFASLVQGKINEVQGKKEVMMDTMKDSSGEDSTPAQGASTQTDDSSTSTGSSSGSNNDDDNAFIIVNSFSAWQGVQAEDFKVGSVTFNGGMSDRLEEGILEIKAPTEPSELQNEIPNILGAPITLKVSKAGEGDKQGTEYYLTVYATNISYDALAKGEYDTKLEKKVYPYKINIVSRLWFLSLRTNCKIFQKQTAQATIKEILEDHGFSSTDFDFKLSQTHESLEYCVQYRETDLNFILRLMAAEGIFCYWKYSDSGAKLFLTDGADANYNVSKKIDPDKEQRLDQDIMVKHWFRSFSTSYITNSHNFKKPDDSLLVNDGDSKTEFGAIKQPTVYDPEHSYPDTDTGKNVKNVCMNDQQSGYELVKVKSKDFNIGVGDQITFDAGRFSQEKGKTYVVVYITRDIQDEANCKLVFTCIPKDVVYSSLIEVDVEGEDEPLANRYTVVIPKIEGPQLAKVTGKSGEGVETDEYGRVHIKFYWDQNTADDSSTSCWVRVVHSAGMQGVPNIGTDVVVQFINGDLNQPLVVGQVHSGRSGNMPDSQLKDKLYSMIGRVPGLDQDGKSDSYNTIVLNDDKDSPSLAVNAPGDLTFTVGTGDNQTTISVTKDGKVDITAPKDIAFTSKQGKITLDGADGVEILSKAGVKVSAGSTLALTATTSAELDGGPSTSVKGTEISIG